MPTLLMFEIGADAPRRPSASDWRIALCNTGAATRPALDQLRTVVTQTALWFIPRTPEGEAWLRIHAMAIAGTVATTLGKPVPMHLRERITTVERRPMLYGYRISRLAVTKRARDWARLGATDLDVGAQATIRTLIERELRDDLRTFGDLPFGLDDDAPFIAIHNYGRPMPIAAVTANRSGHGKPISTLARLGVEFASHWRIEGEHFVGRLQGLGFGRIQRTLPPGEISPTLAAELAAMDDGEDA